MIDNSWHLFSEKPPDVPRCWVGVVSEKTRKIIFLHILRWRGERWLDDDNRLPTIPEGILLWTRGRTFVSFNSREEAMSSLSALIEKAQVFNRRAE